MHQLRKDLEMVLHLEKIRLISNEINDNEYDYENADQAYAQAFADYGMDVTALPAAEAAVRVRSKKGVAVALVAALDDWANNRGGAKGRSQGLALMAVAQAADLDPWRAEAPPSNSTERFQGNRRPCRVAGARQQPPDSLFLLAANLRSCGLVETEIEVLRRGSGSIQANSLST